MYMYMYICMHVLKRMYMYVYMHVLKRRAEKHSDVTQNEVWGIA